MLQIIFVPCRRLLQLCGVDASNLRLTNIRFLGKPDDEVDVTDGVDELESAINGGNEKTCDISASLEDLKGEIDSENISCNDNCDGLNKEVSNSEPSGFVSFENEAQVAEWSRRKPDSVLSTGHELNTKKTLELLQEDVVPNEIEQNGEISKLTDQRDGNNLHGKPESSCATMSGNEVNEHITVDDVAKAFSDNIEADHDVMDKVLRVQVCKNLCNDTVLIKDFVQYFTNTEK